MTWTSTLDLCAQTQKLWDKGILLSELVDVHSDDSSQRTSSFPKRLRLQCPTTTELSAKFAEARIWAAALRLGSKHYRLVEREVRSPVLGSNRIPDEAWLDTLPDALTWIGKSRDAARFVEQVRITQIQQPSLLPWLEKHCHRALELSDAWQRLLNVVGWLQAHPRPAVYLRQVDIAGVDSKFIESHRAVLAELFDMALPIDAIDDSAKGAAQFCQRYGFLDKPLRIRLRWLEPSIAGYGQDVTVTQTVFERLNALVSYVFITENEVNFLAFPDVPNAMVVFGGGFGGLDRLRNTDWLHQRSVHYWGDIDTHGFAMLDQVRACLPHAQSLMMDKTTLTHHSEHWGHEAQAQLRDLPRLTAAELAVYNSLRDNRLRAGLRLEQERVDFGWVKQELEALKNKGTQSKPLFTPSPTPAPAPHPQLGFAQ